MNLCEMCHKATIYNKKRRMCLKCYQKFYRKAGAQSLNIPNDGEINFIKNYFDHKEWIHRPCLFYLEGEKYTPDFYDERRNVFIEVSATRQAYSYNKHKYDKMKEIFPKIIFEVRDPFGNLIEDAESKKKWTYQNQVRNIEEYK